MGDDILIRRAGPGDWAAVAELHSESWRSAYRGIYADSYLDGPVREDRRAFWREALAAWDADEDPVWLAEAAGRALGFACLRLSADPAGPLLDNLHVRPEARGAGIGRRLICAAAGWLAAREPDAPLQLLVWQANAAARAFYASLGGREVETSVGETPDGGAAPEVRVSWARAADLAARISGGVAASA
jgi:ribosomal protein S18 acetylase RimI-like enzyme